MAKSKLLERHKRFCDEYLIDLNAAAAYERAGFKSKTAEARGNNAARLMAKPEIQAYIAERKDALQKRLEITQEDVVSRLWTLANADPRELIELRRGCCRYCWGRKHRYQRTPREVEDDRAAFEKMKAAKEVPATAEFDLKGGIGWNPKREANPNCPECFGDGVEQVFAKDVRNLSPAARLLYAGVKTTQNGLEIKMHDQQAALVNVGKHLGVFRDRVEVTGKDGGAVEHQIKGLLDLVEGADTGIGPPRGESE